jgi:glycosyltransferase involved in cell wall biosynthesis
MTLGKNRRLLVVARRFWPLSDESCHRLMAWASVLRDSGIHVTVLTGRWHSTWPAESKLREIDIVRLLPAPKNSWNESLFLRNIGLWISQNRMDFDVIYVDESGTLLQQVANKNHTNLIPVIGRFAGFFPVTALDDRIIPAHLSHVFSMKPASTAQATEACRLATRIVVPNAHSERQLRASGLEPNRIVRIEDVAWNPIERTEEGRSNAYRALKQINSDFRVPLETPLLVYIGPLRDDLPSRSFIRAATQLLEQDRKFRVWMIGLGPGIRALHELVRDASCHHDILFQSPVDSIEDIIQIADGLLCLPSNGGWEYYAEQAMSAALPVLSVLDSESKASLPMPLQELTASEPTMNGYGIMLRSWLSDYPKWLSAADATRRLRISENHITRSLDAWLSLLKS